MFEDVDFRMNDSDIKVNEPEYIVCNDLLYADDTMILSSSAGYLQQLLGVIIDERKRYGLELNWDKTLCIKINNNSTLRTPTGGVLQTKDRAVYLGGLLTSDCTTKAEIARRL